VTLTVSASITVALAHLLGEKMKFINQRSTSGIGQESEAIAA